MTLETDMPGATHSGHVTDQSVHTEQVTRAESIRSILAAAPLATAPTDDLIAWAGTLCAAEVAVLLIAPGTKIPVDMRAGTQHRLDDEAAQDAAKDAGRRDWHRARSLAGSHLATTDAAVLGTYIAKYRKTFGENVAVNFAIETGASRIVVVDADTAAEVQAFLADCGIEEPFTPTVSTPGARNHAGEWVHSNGGHYYFVTDQDLPRGSGTLKAAGGYAVMWSDRYLLIPPSVRSEGPYRLTGAVFPLPAWIGDEITAHADRKSSTDKAARESVGVLDEGIDAWAESMPWTEVLAPSGWTLTSKLDQCGCEVWTAPGDHSSPKSATTHDISCTLDRYTPVNKPMHVWTDHPGEEFEEWIARTGSKTLSKLQAVAVTTYGGDVGTACAELGLTRGGEAFDAPEGSAAVDEEIAHLPETFWSAHPVLGSIRQAAHHGGLPADALLGTILGRLSAHVDPSIRVTTGVRNPLPLNLFVGLIGWTGSGKTSSDEAAEYLVEFTPPPKAPDPLGDHPFIAGVGEMPESEPLGSGPGLAEAFMRTIPDPSDPKGKKTLRVQGAHKLFISCDEGAALARNITDDRIGHGLGRTLREAWSGRMIGQGGVGERRRKVKNYSLGLVVGLQLPALADMSTSEELDYGTPQRFLWVAATDPSVPDEAPEHPGKVRIPLPVESFHYRSSMAADARRASLARTRVRLDDIPDLVDSVDPLESQREAMIARTAALLVALCSPGRYEITEADRELAVVLFEASLRVHKVAMRFKAERDAKVASSRTRARIAEAVGVAAATHDAAGALERLADRIKGYLAKAPDRTAKWGGRDGMRKKFRSDDRDLGEQARDMLIERGVISYVTEADTLTLLV